MEKEPTVSASKSFPYFAGLTIILVLHKIFKLIDWSWWLVLAPTLIPLGITLIIVIMFSISGATEIIKKQVEAKKNFFDREIDRERSHQYAVDLFDKKTKVHCSTGIDGSDTYGYGKLDDYGYFEYYLVFKENPLI